MISSEHWDAFTEGAYRYEHEILPFGFRPSRGISLWVLQEGKSVHLYGIADQLYDDLSSADNEPELGTFTTAAANKLLHIDLAEAGLVVDGEIPEDENVRVALKSFKFRRHILKKKRLQLKHQMAATAEGFRDGLNRRRVRKRFAAYERRLQKMLDKKNELEFALYKNADHLRRAQKLGDSEMVESLKAEKVELETVLSELRTPSMVCGASTVSGGRCKNRVLPGNTCAAGHIPQRGY